MTCRFEQLIAYQLATFSPLASESALRPAKCKLLTKPVYWILPISTCPSDQASSRCMRYYAVRSIDFHIPLRPLVLSQDLLVRCRLRGTLFVWNHPDAICSNLLLLQDRVPVELSFSEQVYACDGRRHSISTFSCDRRVQAVDFPLERR